MANPILQGAFTTGEVAPALFGQVSLARMHAAAATMRNMWPSWRGGAYSRAGTAYVGFSKQTGRNFPPRMIPFQFSINQGLALEFGNFYMRVIFDGAYVTEAPFLVSAATQASPCVLTLNPVTTAQSAIAINSAVSASYAPGDTVTLAGGTFTQAAVLTVLQTGLAAATPNARGSGYVPGEYITLLGGSEIVKPAVQVATTRVVNATLYSAGSGGTPGTATLTGQTGGGGVHFQVSVTISGAGSVSSINSITVAGSYTTNPSTVPFGPNSDVMSGGGFTTNPPYLSVLMGVNTIVVADSGVLAVNPAGGNMTQFSSSGIGAGATFQACLFSPVKLSVATPGAYTAVPSNPVSQGATSGSGAGATFTVTWAAPATLSTGDWVFINNIGGMTQLNGQTYVATVAGSNVSLSDVYGNPVNSTAYGAYTSGGTVSRIFTLATQYSEADLKWLKFTQSADVMSLCCVNQDTNTEYPPVDLARLADTNWVFTPAVPAPTVTPPSSVSGSASTTGSVAYAYQVTAVSPVDGSESIASPTAFIINAVDIAATAGSITLTWEAVAGVNEYNIYKATPGLSVAPPIGSLFGYAGSAYGIQFLDSNIVADMSQVPPIHQNPFARGRLIAITPVAGGSGYTFASVTINTFSGTAAVTDAIVSGGAVVAFIIRDGGSNYAPTDTVTINGDGTGATATPTIGPQTGTYPGVVAYFQQRRVYAYTTNQPDTYFMSQPGSFTNFDTRTPTIATDAISGNPWSVQVNGIQFMIAVSGGLMVLTGEEAYFLTGQGGSPFSPQPVTPSSESAQPQGFNGCSPSVPPIRIYQDVLYVQSKGSTYRDFSFNISLNNYVGEDITENSPHLFNGFLIKEHAWCEEPNRLLWAVRNDGVLLSLTWVKTEKVSGWCRHDTFGTFQSVCSVTEPPVDALYLAVQRQIGANLAYVVERMDNRIWKTVEAAWCVDCAFSYPQSAPAATLTASTPTGLGSLTGVTGLVGGTGYSAATTASVVDDNGAGPGSGAVAALTIVGGIITGVTFTSPGSGYVNPALVFTDPAGSAGGTGASASPILTNTVTFTASAAVFSNTDVGRVIRMGGGVATVTTFTDNQHVIANFSTPITDRLADIPGGVPTARAQTAGNWTISTPITTVGGLYPLIGATVTGLADGIVIPPQVVSASGTLTLSQAASQITIGMGFQAQLQTVYLETGEPTQQGSRKKIAQVTARIQSSGPFRIGSNQPDGSVQSPIQIAPKWTNLTAAPTTAVAAYNSSTVPLYTGDIQAIPVQGGFQKPGQVALQQDLPLPLEVLALVSEVWLGDNPAQAAPKHQGGQ